MCDFSDIRRNRMFAGRMIGMVVCSDLMFFSTSFSEKCQTRGRGSRVLVLTGPPGAGKTVLVQSEAIAVATEQDPFSSKFIHLYQHECLSSHHYPHHFLNRGRCNRSSMLYLCHLYCKLLISLQPREYHEQYHCLCSFWFCFLICS